MSAKRPPYMVVVAAMLAVSIVMAVFWHDVLYRLDEAWTLQLGLHAGPSAMVQKLALYPDVYVAMPLPWLLLQGTTRVVGHHEVAVRYVQWLFGLLTLALTYQLGRMLYDRAAGVGAVIAYALVPMFVFYAPEARHYTQFLVATVALMVLFWRWLHRPTRTHTLAYVTAGILGVYSHQYVVYVVIAQAVYLLVGVRWQWGRVWRGFTLFALMALALVGGWGIVYAGMFTGTADASISYAMERRNFLLQLVAIFAYHLTPNVLGAVMIWGAVAHEDGPRRVTRGARSLYPLTVAGVTLALAWGVHVTIVPNVTVRNLVFLAVPAALWIGRGLMRLPRQVRPLFIVLLFGVNLWTLRGGFANERPPVMPSEAREVVAAWAGPDTPVIVATDHLWRQIEVSYQLVDRAALSPAQHIAISNDEAKWRDANLMPVPPALSIQQAAQQDALRAATADASEVVWVTWQPDPLDPSLVAMVEAYLSDFTRQETHTFGEVTVAWYRYQP